MNTMPWDNQAPMVFLTYWTKPNGVWIGSTKCILPLTSFFIRWPMIGITEDLRYPIRIIRIMAGGKTVTGRLTLPLERLKGFGNSKVKPRACPTWRDEVRRPWRLRQGFGKNT